MTDDEFNKAASYTKIAPSSLEAARLVLVEGYSDTHVAKLTGKKREDVRGWKYKILHVHRGIIGCPIAWTCVTVCVPLDVADEVRAFEKRAFRKRGENND